MVLEYLAAQLEQMLRTDTHGCTVRPEDDWGLCKYVSLQIREIVASDLGPGILRFQGTGVPSSTPLE